MFEWCAHLHCESANSNTNKPERKFVSDATSANPTNSATQSVISQLRSIRKQQGKLWVMVALVLLVAAVTVIYVKIRSLEVSKLPTVSANATRSSELINISRDTREKKDIKAQITENARKRPANSTAENHSTSPSHSGIDYSVVGQPFQISSSVREGCVEDKLECPLVMASVAKMISEPRDIEWATKMEEKLQTAADREGPGKFAIRNVECRASVCLLEIEVHDQEAFPRYEPFVSSALRAHGAAIGLAETDPSGQRYIVELMDFFRQ